MTVKELWDWAEENDMEDADIEIKSGIYEYPADSVTASDDGEVVTIQ